MKNLIRLTLALIIVSLALLFTVSCKENEPLPPDDENTEELPEEELRVPEDKEYGRGTQSFNDLDYERPDILLAVEKIDALSIIIDKNEIPYPEQLLPLPEIQSLFDRILTMNTLSTIYYYKDTASEFYNAERLYFSTNLHLLSAAFERLFESAANSPHCESFKTDYFGKNLDKYKNGTAYNELLFSLLEEEAVLENKYSSLSAKTVVISYEGKTDSYENVLKHYENECGIDSRAYKKAKEACAELYNEALKSEMRGILVELIKVRRLISDALGLESYETYAYSTLYHDYSSADFKALLDDISQYLIPIYLNLENELFTPYIYDYENTYGSLKPRKNTVINALFDVYTQTDGKLGEIYSYMMAKSLYDVDKRAASRFNGSFTAYIESNRSPYLFVSLDGTASDYTTLAHEFGHFVDAYLNYNSSTSIDLKEVSSQALELLTVNKLRNYLDEDTHKYLLYTELDEIFRTVIIQSFYAAFERDAYSLAYDEITEKKLNEIVAKNAEKFGISKDWNSIDYVLSNQIFIYPFYTESYVSSAIVALEIYAEEIKTENRGIEIYKTLVKRTGKMTFEENLARVALSSPFEKNAVKEILDEIHFLTLGSRFFKPQPNGTA